MDFKEYLDLQQRTFVQYYRCLPVSHLKKESFVEDGNRVIMPQSALDRLSSLHIEYPMQFQLRNPSTDRVSHCSVLEFVADEGFIYIQSWLMAHLGLVENDLVLVRVTSLPKATFVKLQPHKSDFFGISDQRDLLEYNFRKYACVTAGETISVAAGDRRYYLDVLETRPADAVLAIETDCDVEFARAAGARLQGAAAAAARAGARAAGPVPRGRDADGRQAGRAAAAAGTGGSECQRCW